MNPLKDKTLVFSGKFDGYTRAEIEAYAKEHAAKTAKGLSAKVDYLIAGARMGDSKRRKANSLGVPILSFEEFQLMINPQAADAFWSTKPHGEEDTASLLAALKQLDWAAFHPQNHGYELRTILQKQEELYGVNQTHKYVSSEIRSTLNLLHPYGHDGVINCWEVSPNGQWLATSNWMGEDYYKGGILQIWEMETGRVVNQIRVEGGIAWSDYDGLSWNHNSEEIALTFNTNAVGVWNPFLQNSQVFSMKDEPIVYAYVTDGWNRPPGFHWSGDGKSIFINYYYFLEENEVKDDGRDEGDRGCWVNTYKRRGDLSNQAEFGYHDDREKPIYTKEKGAIQFKFTPPKIGKDAVIFQHLNNKAFYDRPPGEDSPLVIGHNDYGAKYKVDPAFPITHNGAEVWGIAASEGILVLPKDFPAEEYLNFSLGNKWTWPLSWVDHIRVEHLYQLKGNKELSYYLGEAAKKSKKPKKGKAKKASFPKSEGKTHEDILQLTIDTLTDLSSGWSSHVDDYMLEAAMTELLRGHASQAYKMIQTLSDREKGRIAAELAFHCLQRGFAEADQFLSLAEAELPKTESYRLCAINSYLAICYQLKGDTKKSNLAERAAIKAQIENSNDDDLWKLLNLWFMTGQIQKANDKLKGDWQDLYFSSFSLPETFSNLVWYASLDDLLRIISIFKDGEKAIIEEHDFYQYAANKIIQDKSYNRLKDVALVFSSYFSYILSTSLKALGDDTSVEAYDIFDFYLQKYEFSGYKREWLHWLNTAAVRYPELAVSVLLKRDWTLKDVSAWDYYLDGKYATYFELGKLIGQLELWDNFEKEWKTLSDAFKANIAGGVALMTGDAELRESLLEQMETLIAKEKSGSYFENLWAQLAAASQQSPKHLDYLKKSLDIIMAKDKDLSMERLVDKLAQEGALNSAYKAWKKIPKGTRHYRINGIFKTCCLTKNYDGLYDMLMVLDAKDLNNRGQKASHTLNMLTNNRGYKF